MLPAANIHDIYVFMPSLKEDALYRGHPIKGVTSLSFDLILSQSHCSDFSLKSYS